MQWGKLKQLDTLSTGNETIFTKTRTNQELATNWNEKWQSKSTLTFRTYKKKSRITSKMKLIFISKCHLSLERKKKNLCSKSAYQIPQGYFWHRNTNDILMSVISILYGLINFSIRCNKKSKYKPKNNPNYHISLDLNMCIWQGHNSLIFDKVFFGEIRPIWCVPIYIVRG